MSDWNYYGDHRVRNCGKNAAPAVFVEGDDGVEEIELPTKFAVCPTCEGRGKHVNPSIDAGGLSAEDFYEDPDFTEHYMRGSYDVSCYQCGGDRVIPVVDEERCEPDLLAAWKRQEELQAEFDRQVAAERRMGC